MPKAAKQYCKAQGCREIAVNRGWCQLHQPKKKTWASGAVTKPEWHRWYCSEYWKRARRLQLTQHPLCAECRRHGVITPAAVVDHILPHRGDYELFCDSDNWQSLCKSCHDRKTAKEDGGFGNASRSPKGEGGS